MKFEKKGLIYCPSGEIKWMKQSAMLPTPVLLEDKLRIYCGFCTDQMIGRIGYVDVNPSKPNEIIKVSSEPVLDIGEDGCFDDNGVVPVSICQNGNLLYLYYVGFQLGVKVPYYMFLGLAISRDGGETFTRYSKTPILERTDEDLFARCGACVINDNGVYKIWYIGSVGEGWTTSNGKLKPLYTMKYMESNDGIHWPEESVVCMKFKNSDEHGFGRPFVWKEDNIYKMMYSIRTYSRGYYIGYAESEDGVSWIRKDEEAGIDLSESGWDDSNLSYPYICQYKDKTYLFYNGNDCGKTGFGYAECCRKK